MKVTKSTDISTSDQLGGISFSAYDWLGCPPDTIPEPQYPIDFPSTEKRQAWGRCFVARYREKRKGHEIFCLHLPR